MSRTNKKRSSITKKEELVSIKNDISHENIEIVKEYLNELKTIKEAYNKRKQLLNIMFWEYENHNTHLYEDRDAKIYKIISDKQIYPNSFLGSSLGFNKTNMDQKFLDILHKFRLDKKPNAPSPRNSVEFEKLKLLIIKLFEISAGKGVYKKK
ncbi:hypothetical protein EHP00_1713 [Ecytonucleospora hepatopenaei]|uniref:Uncharacterized protein n=1 Tax=Ecytonucleospora hepatopenaei TaxID=646526 RepID=A0A1W0E7H5_9MICR|nr:hypothetical protein EHP00_1713 [Ecytonucleospora hepatopenaei]